MYVEKTSDEEVSTEYNNQMRYEKSASRQEKLSQVIQKTRQKSIEISSESKINEKRIGTITNRYKEIKQANKRQTTMFTSQESVENSTVDYHLLNEKNNHTSSKTFKTVENLTNEGIYSNSKEIRSTKKSREMTLEPIEKEVKKVLPKSNRAKKYLKRITDNTNNKKEEKSKSQDDSDEYTSSKLNQTSTAITKTSASNQTKVYKSQNTENAKPYLRRSAKFIRKKLEKVKKFEEPHNLENKTIVEKKTAKFTSAETHGIDDAIRVPLNKTYKTGISYTLKSMRASKTSETYNDIMSTKRNIISNISANQNDIDMLTIIPLNDFNELNDAITNNIYDFLDENNIITQTGHESNTEERADGLIRTTNDYKALQAEANREERRKRSITNNTVEPRMLAMLNKFPMTLETYLITTPKLNLDSILVNKNGTDYEQYEESNYRINSTEYDSLLATGNNGTRSDMNIESKYLDSFIQTEK